MLFTAMFFVRSVITIDAMVTEFFFINALIGVSAQKRILVTFVSYKNNNTKHRFYYHFIDIDIIFDPAVSTIYWTRHNYEHILQALSEISSSKF